MEEGEAPEKAGRFERGLALAKKSFERLGHFTQPLSRLIAFIQKAALLGAAFVILSFTLLMDVDSLGEGLLLVLIIAFMAIPSIIMSKYKSALVEVVTLPRTLNEKKDAVLSWFEKHENDEEKETLSKKARAWLAFREVKEHVSDIRELIGPDSPILILANPLWGTLTMASVLVSLALFLLSLPLLIVALVVP
jgi:hypothetical protein